MVGGIQLVGPDGPRPLSNLTIVRAVGCLSCRGPTTRGPWSGPAARVRFGPGSSTGPTPEELKARRLRPLGTQTFPLLSVTPQGASLAGHKVQVKGVLNRQNAIERINVMSLESVAPTCGG